MTAEAVVDKQPQPRSVNESLEQLVRNARRLVESSIGVGERQLAAALSAGERMRDGVISPAVLERARTQPIFRRLREDGHRMVDLAADLGGAAFIVTFDAAEELFRAMAEPRGKARAVAS